MESYTFTISKNALINLIADYANYKKTDNYAAQWAVEKWMNVLGISPYSNLVMEIVNKEN